MSRSALGILLLSLATLTLTVQTRTGVGHTLGEVVLQRGGPSFRASFANVNQGRLTVVGFEDVPTGDDIRGLRGGVLIYGEPLDMLRLWLAKVDWDMKQATPGMGYEGSGLTWQEMIERSRQHVEPLARPTRITLIFVNGDGAVYRKQTVPIIAIQFSARGLERMRLLTGHDWTIYGLVFTPDGRTLISGGADGSVRVWDVETGGERANYR